MTFTPVPKPEPRSESDRLTARIASSRKLNANRKPIPRSSPPSRTAPPKRKAPPAKRNAKRAKANHERAYGEYAKWIRSLPCCACGVSGFTQAAHTTTGGMGRKADAKTLVPLCGPHYVPPDFLYTGCHSELHRVGPLGWAFASLDLKAIAAQLWADYSRVAGGGREGR